LGVGSAENGDLSVLGGLEVVPLLICVFCLENVEKEDSNVSAALHMGVVVPWEPKSWEVEEEA
jgi:hypothetical protein